MIRLAVGATLVWLLAGSVAKAQGSSTQSDQYVLIYSTWLQGSFEGEDFEKVPGTTACLGSLPTPSASDLQYFPSFYPVNYNNQPLKCSPGTDVNTGSSLSDTVPPPNPPSTFKSTMGVRENSNGLTIDVSSTYAGTWGYGGGHVEEILYHPDVSTLVSPRGPLTFTFQLRGSGTPNPNSPTPGTTGYYVTVTIVSDNNVISTVFDSQHPEYLSAGWTLNGTTLTSAPLTIGASQKYSLEVDLLAGAEATGPKTGINVPSASVEAQFLLNSYVALGDSYASGAGDPPYGPGAGDVTCQRSEDAVPIRLHEPLGLVFPACSGANVRALYNGQGSKQPTPQFNFLDNNTSLVSIMIGGNDEVNIAKLLAFCTLGPINRVQYPTYIPGLPCGLQQMTAGAPTIAQDVGSNLATLHAALRSAYLYIRQQAPRARVIVPTYPNPFSANSTPLFCQNYTPIDGQDGRFYWLVVDELNRVVMRAAWEAGVEPIDLNYSDNSEFPEAGVCAPVSLFYTIADMFRNGGYQNLTATFHPNSAGEAEMARIIKDYLNGNSGPPINTSLNVQLGQNYSTTVNVTSQQSTALFSTQWPGSDIVMSLVSPSGEVINRNTTDAKVQHTLGSTFEIYEVSLPEPGKWTVNFYGADVAADGEQLNFYFSQLPRAPGDADGDGVATCADMDIVKAAFGTKAGQSAFDARADLNGDGVVNVVDLSLVAQNLLSNTTCH